MFMFTNRASSQDVCWLLGWVSERSSFEILKTNCLLFFPLSLSLSLSLLCSSLFAPFLSLSKQNILNYSCVMCFVDFFRCFFLFVSWSLWRVRSLCEFSNCYECIPFLVAERDRNEIAHRITGKKRIGHTIFGVRQVSHKDILENLSNVYKRTKE